MANVRNARPASHCHSALQLERLAADKAAQQLAMERELQQARTEAQSVKRRGAMDRSLSMGLGGAAAAADEGMVPMDSLGHAYRRWVGASGCEGLYEGACAGVRLPVSAGCCRR